MAAYRNAVLRISAQFEGLEFHHVSRGSNQAVDILNPMCAKRNPVPQNTFLEWLPKPSVVWQDGDQDAAINGPERIIPPAIVLDDDIIDDSTIEETVSAHEVMAIIAPWTEPFLAYLLRKELPDDQTEARRIIRCSKSYKVHEGEL
ncbi:uncharacterized protein [Aegilops tauschii subsp. strangulata]|uniref:uncharacterized protein n=1 Tax=Aegilops tauschii subsp. strangulata TaxID=200361 RepID=UPI00098B17A4|nr:uncharacterized protein LOC109740089 [Aegilops tauschii subsp. strangulata]